MNPETGRFGRCAKHQSQNFTGFCPICLVERLSNVDCVESAKNPSCGVRNEIFEISESFPVSQRKNDGFRVRKTLLYLFELDDLKELEKIGRASTSHKVCACSLGIDQLGLNFELEGKGLDDRAGASGCSCASGSTSFDGEKSDPLGGESLKDRRIAFWLHSKLSMKRWKWRSRSTSNKGTGIESTYLDDKPKLWEKPRHSWDGSMMSKALSCSFSCLEEQQDGSGKIKATFPDGSNDHNSFPTDASFGHLHKGFHGRKKSNGWIRVWDWSITSPFRDFAKRNGQVLERSLSESWRDNHRDNDAKYFHPSIEAHRNGTSSSNGRVNRSLSGDIVAANDNRKGQKPDLQKMREFKLSRSHSVRYSSPGNHDNGLLRFYLTPLRTSRRNTAKCRRRTSHSLARGFLGP